MNPQRFHGVFDGGFGCEEFCHTSLHVATIGLIISNGGFFRQQSGSLDSRRHVCELDLYGLMLTDGHAKRLAFLSVSQRRIQRSSSNPDATSRHVDAAESQT